MTPPKNRVLDTPETDLNPPILEWEGLLVELPVGGSWRLGNSIALGFIFDIILLI